MSNKVSVITVVFNDVKHIQKTMDSFFSQTWEDKEYIVIDGGSTDGTADVIKQYADKLAYWCSEKDDGIYDAMNKGIMHCTGDWINFLNCGDQFVNDKSIEEVFKNDTKDIDVIYGDSIASSRYSDMPILASSNINELSLYPIYRHGSSFIRNLIQKKFLFDLEKKKTFGFALDWNCIFKMYHNGAKFKKINVYIQRYDTEGTSAQKYKSAIFNYRITSQYGFSIHKLLYLFKTLFRYTLDDLGIIKWMRAFVFEFIINCLLC